MCLKWKITWSESTRGCFGSAAEKRRALRGFAQQKVAGSWQQTNKTHRKPIRISTFKAKQSQRWRPGAERPWGSYSGSATEHLKHHMNSWGRICPWRRMQEQIIIIIWIITIIIMESGVSTEHPSGPDLCSHVLPVYIQLHTNTAVMERRSDIFEVCFNPPARRSN